MKKAILIYFIISTITFSFGQKKLLKEVDERKVISYLNDSVTAEASVKSFDIKTKDKRLYFWYWKNEMQQNYGSYNGTLFHGVFIKYDLEKNLIEKTNFKKGLVRGKYYYWNKDGSYSKIEKWKKGIKKGKYKIYDETGSLIEVGRMKNNLKSGLVKFYLDNKIIYTKRYSKGIVKEDLDLKEKTSSEKEAKINKEKKEKSKKDKELKEDKKFKKEKKVEKEKKIKTSKVKKTKEPKQKKE